MWRRTWSSPSTTPTNCTSAEQQTQTARRTPASSSEDFPAVGASGGRDPSRTSAPEADLPCTRRRLTARLPPGVSEAVCGRPALVRAGVVRGPPRAARLGQGPAQRHILRLMLDRPPNAAWLKLGAEPGLCGACRHGKLNETRRGGGHLPCTRAPRGIALSRYPRLPVTQCGGFERREEKP